MSSLPLLLTRNNIPYTHHFNVKRFEMQVTRYNRSIRGKQQVMRTQYTFQTFINDELKKRGWSQRDLATQMGVSSSTISRMLDEQKPSKPDVEQLLKLSRVLHIGLETITALAFPEQFEPTNKSRRPYHSANASTNSRMMSSRLSAIIRQWSGE
ncbi:MAG: helix-turn-helix transcriptional regulator [Chloroflexi bacterium]|uniref:helix-turn-helix domain-containing protein n=1 Tax=Candidatus Flexifilum breve TaxID=3140694 RepID=UPI003134697A|nr:helix-turn-helix transcriptional regulator [Chloroflexota bacterium]